MNRCQVRDIHCVCDIGCTGDMHCGAWGSYHITESEAFNITFANAKISCCKAYFIYIAWGDG